MKPPFYETLNATRYISHDLRNRADRDGCFRRAWSEFIAANPDDPLGKLVAPLLAAERRTEPIKADPRFMWKW